MQPFFSSSLCCFICREPSTPQTVLSACGHSLCYRCLPLMLYSKLQAGLFPGFLQTQGLNQKCLVCGDDGFLLSKAFLDFFEVYKNVPQNIPKKDPEREKTVCDACEKNEASQKCEECNQNYCSVCGDFIHEVNKKFGSHVLVKLEPKATAAKQGQFFCACVNRRVIECFCLQCEMGVCKLCGIIDHSGHKQTNIDELLMKGKKIHMPSIQQHLFQVQKTFQRLNDDFLASASKAKTAYLSQLNSLISDITAQLSSFKEAFLSNFNKETSIMSIQLAWMGHAFGYLGEEILENPSLHPNFMFQSYKYFSHSVEKKSISFEALKFDESGLKAVIEGLRKQFMGLISNMKGPVVSLESNRVFKINISHINTEEVLRVTTNPADLMNKAAERLEADRIDLPNFKSNLCVFFNSNDKGLLAVPGAPVLNYYPINVYNMTTKKKELMFNASSSRICFIGIYPKYGMKNDKKWIFSGERNGFLRVYAEDDLSKQFNIKDKYSLNTKTEISEAILFEDKFGEIMVNKNEITIYALVSFADPKQNSTKIYNLATGEAVKAFPNYNNQETTCMNFYYDEILLKTALFFGQSSCVSLYDLKTTLSTLQFPSKTQTTAIQFILDFDNIAFPKRLVIFSQNSNIITVGDIESGLVLHQLVVPGVSVVNDVCVWRMHQGTGFIFIAGHQEKVFCLINLENYQVVSSKKSQKGIVNIRKGWLEENKIKKECLITLDFGIDFGMSSLKQYEINLYK